jgi:hypothetical protein
MHDLYIRIKPGDIGFDGGVGISGFIIRTGTQSQYGHCWIYHEKLDSLDDGTEVWRTVEAGPKDGLIWRERTIKPNKVVRIWSNEEEQNKILSKSASMVGQKYGWGEIFRIAAHILGLKIRRRKDNPDRAICSNHVAQCVLEAFPLWRVLFEYEFYEIWPGELAKTLDGIYWVKDRSKEDTK